MAMGCGAVQWAKTILRWFTYRYRAYSNGSTLCGAVRIPFHTSNYSFISIIHVILLRTHQFIAFSMTSWDVARLTVRLGDHNIKSDTEVQHVERKIKRVVRHRNFDARTLYSDVAVLTMDSPISYTKNVRPICMPQSVSRLYNGQMGTVIGWGSLRESEFTFGTSKLKTFPNTILGLRNRWSTASHLAEGIGANLEQHPLPGQIRFGCARWNY